MDFFCVSNPRSVYSACSACQTHGTVQWRKHQCSQPLSSWSLQPSRGHRPQENKYTNTFFDFLFCDHFRITEDLQNEAEFSNIHHLAQLPLILTSPTTIIIVLKTKKLILVQYLLKSRDITLPTKVCLVKAMVFPVVMYGCESWTIKKAEHRQIDAFELWCWRRLLRVPGDCKEIQSVYPKGSQSWISIGSTDTEAETPILWPPDEKNWLIGKDPDAVKDWR